MSDTPASEAVQRITGQLSELHAAQRAIGERIEAGEAAESERFQRLDEKIADVHRLAAEARDARTVEQRDDWNRAAGAPDELEQYVIRGDKGEGLGVRLYDAEETISYAGMEGVTTAPGLLSDRPRTAWQRDLQAAAGRLQLARTIGADKATVNRARGDFLHILRSGPAVVARAFAEGVNRLRAGTLDAARMYGASRAGDIQRAMGGAGDAWALEQTAPGIFRPWILTTAGVDFLNVRQVAASEKILKVSGNPEFFSGSLSGYDDPAKLPASGVTTSAENIDVGIYNARIAMNRAWREDLAPGAYEEILSLIDRAAGWLVGSVAFHGDAAATHQDAIASWTLGGRRSTNLGSSIDPLRSVEGFRADAHDNSATRDGGSDTSFVATLVATLGLMGERAAASGIVACVGAEYLVSTVMVDPKIVTLDVFGANATIARDPRSLNGLFHVGLRLTEWLSAEYAATGLYTGSGAKNNLVCVASEDWEVVSRRDAMVELASRPETGHDHLVASVRAEVRKREAAAVKSAAVSYNL